MLTKILLFVAATATETNGFAFDVFAAFKANPVLSEVSQSKMGEKFSIRMDIGQNDDETHMNLHGLTIELLQGKAPKDEQVGLPGVEGPHPQTSTGALGLNVLSSPSFIDLFGTQKVRFEKGCYELIWKKDHLAGSLVCGFDVPVGAKRNGASLPAGRLYLSFPVWSQEGLAIRQAEKNEAEEKVKEYSQERDSELQQYATSNNLFKKALHYRNAVAAVEKIDFTGIRWLREIPNEAEVTAIGSGLLLNKKGTIWTKKEGFMGKKHTELGEVFLDPLVEEATENVLRP